MKNVLYISPSTAVKGGISTVINGYLASDLAKNYHIFIASSHSDGPKILKLIHAFLGLGKTAYYLLTKSIDIVHIHAGNIISFKRKFYYLKLVSLFKCKVIFHHHGGALLEDLHSYSSKWQNRIWSTFSKVNVVICLSERLKKDILQIASRANIRVVPNSVSVPPLPNESGELVNGIRLAFLGHINENKGIFDLLRVLRKLLDSGFYVNLNIGGVGDIRRLKRDIKALGLDSHVKFMGWISNAERDLLLKRTDIFILPSYSECLPMTILEAMSYGIPVISTPVGGIPELMVDNETGFLVKPGDLNALYERIVRLATDKEARDKFGRNSRRVIEQKYNIVNSIKAIDSIYNML